MIRLDPATASSSAPPSVPAWAITSAGPGCLRAGERVEGTQGGAWRQRLAVRCAASSMRLAGRILG
ncbi:hypothetical protein EN974_24510, partial [Mesorhizobium sp. M7A.F.Ca.CA.001.12.2.1]